MSDPNAPIPPNGPSQQLEYDPKQSLPYPVSLQPSYAYGYPPPAFTPYNPYQNAPRPPSPAYRHPATYPSHSPDESRRPSFPPPTMQYENWKPGDAPVDSRRSTLTDNSENDRSRPTTADGKVKDEPEEEKMDHRKRKRNRTIRSCVPCHNHKRKCDRKRPCGRCTALGLTGSCVYEVDEARDPDDPNVIETDHLRRRIAELEQVVRELRQRQPRGSIDDEGGKKRRVIVDRFARFKMDEAAMAEVAADYGAEPYSTNLLPGEELVHDSIGRKTFLGAPAGRSMLRRLAELTSKTPDASLLTVPEDAAYTGVFPDMRKTFPFTTIWSHENFSGEIIGLLPTQEQSELLLLSWEEEVASFFQAWHLRFFTMSTAEKMAVPLSCLSLYLMICSLGCMMRASVAEMFGHPNREVAMQAKASGVTANDPKDLTSSRLQSELYLSAAYQALRLCSFLSSPTLHTIQAGILINVYLLNSERASDAWSLMGSLVRQCVATGLHVDPAGLDSKISLRDAEVRRRIWWTVAGLDTLLCVSFGRPTVINFFNTKLPQDLTEDNLADGAKAAPLSETTDASYHTAYFQLTVPSLELLDRVFHVNRTYSRSPVHGWFSPAPGQVPENTQNTYTDAIRLGRDVTDWYATVPKGMRFDDDDNAETLLATRNRKRINQTLALCVKSHMIVLILHRPYLRADPTAYPESTDFCFNAAHRVLSAYKAMSLTKSSIIWSWWTMSYRAFHAGAVCAFLAIRQPGTPLAAKCMDDLRGAILIFEDRIANWNMAHPVQADLAHGLVKLERLASAATQQHLSPRLPQYTYAPVDSLQLAQIRAFPQMGGKSPIPPAPDAQVHPQQSVHPGGMLGDGFNGTETLALPQFWADMFGIKMDVEEVLRS